MAPSPSAIVARIDGWQRQHAAASFPHAVFKTFSDDRGGRHVARITYYAFFSLFPLILASVTVMAYVIDDPDRRAELADGTLGQIPLVGSDLANSSGIQGNAVALVVGLVAAVWAALAAMQAAQDAVNDLWGVSRLEQPRFFWKRLRSLGALLAVTLSVGVSAVLTQVVTLVSGLHAIGRTAAIAGTLVVTTIGYVISYMALSAKNLGFRAHLPGAMAGAVGFFLVQLLGQRFALNTVAGAQDTYGTFAGVIGLFAWLSLLAWVALLGAEVNVVSAERLWPRSLGRSLPPTEADLRVFSRMVAAQRSRDDQHVDITFKRIDNAG
jgi:YihY family inner membrane protein